MANHRVPVKWFLSLAVNERVPDHSTLIKFKARLLERGKLGAAEDLLAQIVALARQHGIRFGSLQVMDSVHGEADVNPEKDRQRGERAGRPARDEEARWRSRAAGASGAPMRRSRNTTRSTSWATRPTAA